VAAVLASLLVFILEVVWQKETLGQLLVIGEVVEGGGGTDIDISLLFLCWIFMTHLTILKSTTIKG
jgi:hypothetical protein